MKLWLLAATAPNKDSVKEILLWIFLFFSAVLSEELLESTEEEESIKKLLQSPVVV